jgi:hypothetical protein
MAAFLRYGFAEKRRVKLPRSLLRLVVDIARALIGEIRAPSAPSPLELEFDFGDLSRTCEADAASKRRCRHFARKFL